MFSLSLFLLSISSEFFTFTFFLFSFSTKIPYFFFLNQVDSAARLLQSAMRSFVVRRQTLSKRPPLPPRGTPGNVSRLSRSASGSDRAQAVFAAVDAADRSAAAAAGGGARGGGGGLSRASSSRKSVAGAVGGGWEASGAHSATTLVDVFPAEPEDPDSQGDGADWSERKGVGQLKRKQKQQSSRAAAKRSALGQGGSGDGVGSKGVSSLVTKFLEGPALERFGSGDGGSTGNSVIPYSGPLFGRKSSMGTLGGRRSTVNFAATNSTGRMSSVGASVRFVGGRRSTVGGWGENDEAARPGTSVCKDCLSDVASLLAVAMSQRRGTGTVMEVCARVRVYGYGGEEPLFCAVCVV